MTQAVWFELVNDAGDAVTSIDVVEELPDEADVVDFRKAVFMEVVGALPKKVVSLSLIVFANRAAYELQQPLKVDSPIAPFGCSEEDAVFVLVPTKHQGDMLKEPRHKKPKISTKIKYEYLKMIRDSLDINTWQVGGVPLDICRIISDFPEWFYVRKETVDIIKVFEAQMKANYNTLLTGSPGVGKSMLVVLFAFYIALIQKKRVVLFRKQRGYSLLYLDIEKNNCWRKDGALIEDLYAYRQLFKSAELCLDGFKYKDVENHFGVLSRFRLLATSAPYHFEDGEYTVMRKCLVPFWSLSDLNAIGAHRKWPEHEMKERYFYSGGNLRSFLASKGEAKILIDKEFHQTILNYAELFNTQYGNLSECHVDRLRMTTFQATGHRDLKKYMSGKHWICVITSEYALRRLGKYVNLSYCEELWSKGRVLGDDGLLGMAFKNYVHTLARDGKKIELQVRAYDRVKARQHSYAAVELEAKLCLNDDVYATECNAAIKSLTSLSGNYWYPSHCCLETIDSVVKLNIDEQPKTIGLIQMTISDKLPIDSIALDKYATFFPNGSRYIALVPNKEISDNFRLVPGNLATKVPLDVAYITNWCF